MNYTPKDGRIIEEGQEILIYRNLNRGCWSIKDVKTNLVLGYCMSVQLKDVTTKVSEAGRKRVIREKRKNVHAYIKGKLVGFSKGKHKKLAYYNPYKTKTFVDENGNPFTKAESVTLTDGQILY